MKRDWKMRASLTKLGSILAALVGFAGTRADAATVTATFENYGGGQFLGFAAVTDPLSGITFNNINSNGGLGACYFNSPTGSSLYRSKANYRRANV